MDESRDWIRMQQKQWLKEIHCVYKNLDTRKDVACWRTLLTDPIYNYEKTRKLLENYIKKHPYLPYIVLDELERLQEDWIFSVVCPQVGGIDSFYIRRTKTIQVKDEPDKHWFVDDYINQYKQFRSEYQNEKQDAKQYLDELNKLVEKGYESVYDIKDRIELCLLLGMDARDLSRELAEYEDSNIEVLTPVWQIQYGRVVQCFYEGNHNVTMEKIRDLLDYTQVLGIESPSLDKRCLQNLFAMCCHLKESSVLQEYEQIVLNDDCKKQAILEHRQYEYYILCADYHYIKQNVTECLRVAEGLENIYAKFKKELCETWGTALFDKRYKHNLYLMAQCMLSLGDYESAQLYAELLLEENGQCIELYDIHMEASFFLHRFNTVIRDYQIFMEWIMRSGSLTGYHKNAPHFMVAFVYLTWGLDRQDLWDKYQKNAYRILEQTQDMVYFSEEDTYFIESLQNGVAKSDPLFAYHVLRRWLQKQLDRFRCVEVLPVTAKNISEWNPLLLYYYAMGNKQEVRDKNDLDIWMYLYKQYGVYGEVCAQLSIRHQYRYFEIDFRKRDQDQAVKYLKQQVKDGDDGYDRILLAELLLRFGRLIEAYRVLAEIPEYYRTPTIWFMMAIISSKQWGFNGIEGYQDALNNGCDTALMWYLYAKYILISNGAQIPFEEQLEKAKDCSDHLIETFSESAWRGWLVQAEIHLWKNETAQMEECVNRARLMANPSMTFEDRLSLYRWTVYTNWINKNISKAWEAAKEGQEYILSQDVCDDKQKQYVQLCEWWVYVARILMNVSLSKAWEYLQNQMETYDMERLVLTSPELAKAGMKLYKKRIMIQYLDGQDNNLEQDAQAFLACFQTAYPNGNLEAYANVKMYLPERMDEAGWYYMAIGNEYMAEECFNKQISQSPCYHCKAGVCYKGYLNRGRWLYRKGEKRKTKDCFSYLKLPKACKERLLR